MGACTNPGFLKVLKFILLIIDIIRIIVPIGLIVIGTIDLSKSVITNDEQDRKKNLNIFLKRLIYAALVFAVPWIVEAFMSLLGDLSSDIDLSACIENVDNIGYYDKIYEEQEEQERKNREELNIKRRQNLEIKSLSTSNSKSSISKDGSYVGQKYNLSDSELKGIAMLCQKEQGDAKGAAAEASLMANRYELYHTSNQNSFYNYVRDSGWWANSKTFMANTSELKNDVYSSVEKVLKYGNRTLPFYVDEHDCINCGDVVNITNDNLSVDKKNRNNYIKDKTVIHNRYKAVYTFYEFPTSISDPFGYTDEAKTKYNSLNR